MAQVAADMLGLPLENISIKLGDLESRAVGGQPTRKAAMKAR